METSEILANRLIVHFLIRIQGGLRPPDPWKESRSSTWESFPVAMSKGESLLQNQFVCLSLLQSQTVCVFVLTSKPDSVVLRRISFISSSCPAIS